MLIRPKVTWIDFDGTITLNGEWKGVGAYGKLNDIAKEKLTKAKNMGFEIQIFTARGWNEKQLIEKYLTNNNIPFDIVICGKPYAIIAIDDKVVDNWYDYDKKLDKIGELKNEQ